MAGRNSQGTRILHSAGGSTGTFVEVEHVTNISGPNGQAANIDVTDLRSTGKEFLAGLADYGQITLDINYYGATKQVALFTMFANHSDAQSFKIALPTDSTDTEFDVLDFDATVSGCVFGARVDDKQTMQVTLKTSGAVGLTQNVAAGSLA